MTPTIDEVYEIRGHDVHLEYDEETHSATVTSDAFDSTTDNIEEELSDSGIYTRVQTVLDTGPDSVTFSLKPAAGLELRDEKGTLRKRPVNNPTPSSVITKQRDSYRYSATVPTDILEEFGIIDKERVAVYPVVDEGTLGLVVERDSDVPHAMMARRENSGQIRIPSFIGAAADLDGHLVDWEYREDENTLVGATSVELQQIDTNEDATGQHTIVGIARKQQSVSPTSGDYEGDSWDQEHFQTYIRSDHANRLGWTDEDLVDIRFARDGDTLLVVLDTDVREEYTEKAPCVKRLNSYAKKKGEESGSQLNFYLPNTLVYSLRLMDNSSDPRLRWAVVNDSSLAGWRP